MTEELWTGSQRELWAAAVYLCISLSPGGKAALHVKPLPWPSFETWWHRYPNSLRIEWNFEATVGVVT